MGQVFNRQYMWRKDMQADKTRKLNEKLSQDGSSWNCVVDFMIVRIELIHTSLLEEVARLHIPTCYAMLCYAC